MYAIRGTRWWEQWAWNTLADLENFHQIRKPPPSIKLHVKIRHPRPSVTIQSCAANIWQQDICWCENTWAALKTLIDLHVRMRLRCLARTRLSLTRNVLKKITLRSAYAMCFFCETSLSLAFQLTWAHSRKENDAEDDEVVDEVEAPEEQAGRPRRRAESLRRRCLLSAWAFAEFFFAEDVQTSGKHWGHFKQLITNCTPKDRSSSQGSQDEIHKPCFLLKIGSPILPKHPATWHEVGHPSGQDMAEKFLDLSNLLAYRFFWFLHFPSSKQTSKHKSCWIIVSQHRLHARLRSTTFPWCGKLCAWHAPYLRIKVSILITGARNGLVTKQFKLVVVLRSHHIVNTLHGHFWARIKIPKSSGQKPYGFTRLLSIPDCHQLQTFSK